MSDSRINPYSPPPIADDDDRTRLAFDAVIEERDYLELLPRRDSEAFLSAVLLGLLAFSTLLMLTVIAVGLKLHGWNDALIPVVVVAVIFLSGTVFVFRFARPVRRARRTLKRNPDLLGIVRGQVTESGLAFYDGALQYWLGPQRLLASSASAAGFRIPLDEKPYRYLALTPRMFDQYNEQVASRLKNVWHQSSAAATDQSHPAGLDLWQELNPMPDDAVSFSGTATLQYPMRTPQLRQTAFIEFAASISAIFVGVFWSDSIEGIDKYVPMVIGVLGLVFSAYHWKQYFFDTTTQTWNQRGWISPRELAVVRGCVGVRISLNEIAQVTDHGGLVSLASESGDTYYLYRDQFQNDGAWTQTLRYVAAVANATANRLNPDAA